MKSRDPLACSINVNIKEGLSRSRLVLRLQHRSCLPPPFLLKVSIPFLFLLFRAQQQRLLLLIHFLYFLFCKVGDFTQQLSAIEAQHGEQLQQLVETFRKRNAELRKER